MRKAVVVSLLASAVLSSSVIERPLEAAAGEPTHCTYCTLEGDGCYYCVINAPWGWQDCATPACDWCASLMYPCYHAALSADGSAYLAHGDAKDKVLVHDAATSVLRSACSGAVVERAYDPNEATRLRNDSRRILI